MEKLKHVISTRQFDDSEFLLGLFESANRMERDDVFRALTGPLRGRILATLFFEPSTRTRFRSRPRCRSWAAACCPPKTLATILRRPRARASATPSAWSAGMPMSLQFATTRLEPP